jgi:hypothetical protein
MVAKTNNDVAILVFGSLSYVSIQLREPKTKIATVFLGFAPRN